MENSLKKNAQKTLSLIADEKKQFEYQANVPTAKVGAELFSMWFDDFYIPDSELFQKTFSAHERESLAKFNELLAQLSGGVSDNPSLDEIHNHPLWVQTKDLSNITLSDLGH